MKRDVRSDTQSCKRGAGRIRRRHPKDRERAARSLATRAAIMLLASLFTGGCQEEKAKPSEPTAPNQATSIAASTEMPEAAPTAVATGSPSASQSADAAADATSPTGTWEGSYNAKKGSVELPSKVKDKTRNRDEGATVVGPGTVTLTISPDGEVSGKSKGALGDATLSGTAEGGMVRASVFPDNPALPSAMTGVLVGMLKDGVIRAEIRVAGPDATIVRESEIELKRK